jgi:hypothetical protein
LKHMRGKKLCHRPLQKCLRAEHQFFSGFSQLAHKPTQSETCTKTCLQKQTRPRSLLRELIRCFEARRVRLKCVCVGGGSVRAAAETKRTRSHRNTRFFRRSRRRRGARRF